MLLLPHAPQLLPPSLPRLLATALRVWILERPVDCGVPVANQQFGQFSIAGEAF